MTIWDSSRRLPHLIQPQTAALTVGTKRLLNAEPSRVGERLQRLCREVMDVPKPPPAPRPAMKNGECEDPREGLMAERGQALWPSGVREIGQVEDGAWMLDGSPRT